MSERIDLTLRLERGLGVPCGELVVSGSAQRFRGWLELLRCLEEARSQTSRDDGGTCDE